MKRILVPIDLSESSTHVVKQAVELAKLQQAEIYLLHVASLDIGFIVGDVSFQYLPELEKTVLEEDAKKIHEFEMHIQQQGIQVKAYVQQGIPHEVILKEAKEKQVDCIVIGSMGHSALYEAFVGSVCHDVMKHSNVPMFVVPAEKKA